MSTANENNVKNALSLALDVSLSTKDMAMLKLALDKGADAQVVLRRGHQSSSWEVIDLALAAGADLNTSVDGAANGDTYLIAAVRANRLDCADGYLNRGADPNHALGLATALEVLLVNIKDRKSQGYEPSPAQKNLSMRLLAALTDAQGQQTIVLKKRIILQAPQPVFKTASAKPKGNTP